AVLGEFRVVGDEGVGLDDVGQGGAGSLEASLDVLADLLDLGAHIALADTNALRVTRQLTGDKDHFAGAADGDDVGIGRVSAAHADMDALRLNLLALDRHHVSFPYNAAPMIRRARSRRQSERGSSCR